MKLHVICTSKIMTRSCHNSAHATTAQQCAQLSSAVCQDSSVSAYSLVPSCAKEPGHWFNMKMPPYQDRKSHCRDRTILRPSYLPNENSYTGKMTSLCWIKTLQAQWWQYSGLGYIQDQYLKCWSARPRIYCRSLGFHNYKQVSLFHL